MCIASMLFCCSGYLHAHISYLDDTCQTCLLLLAVDKDLFFKLSECRDKIKEAFTFSHITQTNTDVFVCHFNPLTRFVAIWLRL